MNSYHRLHPTEPREAIVTGVIDRVYYASDSGASVLLDLKTLDGKRIGGKLRVDSTGNACYASEGTQIQCMILLGDAASEAEYLEYRMFSFPDRIYAYAPVSGEFVIGGQTMSLIRSLEMFGDRCRMLLYSLLPEDTADFCMAVILGDKTGLSSEIKRDFRRIGVSHILAVSGMHLSVLIGGAQFLLRHGRIGGRAQSLILCVFLLLFMAVSGFSPSVVRSGIMWILVCLSKFLGTRADAPTSLFASAAFLCLFSPTAVFDIGLLLSVSAALGLIVMMQPLSASIYSSALFKRPLMQPVRVVLLLFAMTVSATMFSLPITILAFGEISVLSPLSNLLLHIPVSVILYMTPILILLSPLAHLPVLSFLVTFSGGVLSGAVTLISRIAARLSAIEGCMIGVRYSFVVIILIVSILLGCLLYRKYRVTHTIFAAFAVFCLMLTIGISVHNELVRKDVDLSYSVYKKNDIITMISDGYAVLIDDSDGAYTSATAGWEQLSAQNQTELDVYMLTHYHDRHVSTLSKLLGDTIIRRLLIPEPQTDDEIHIAKKLSGIAENAGVEVQQYRAGSDVLKIGFAEIAPLPRVYLKRSTQPVIGWTLRAHGHILLFLGGGASEIEDAAFSEQRDNALLRANTMLFGIHGPKYKSTIALLFERCTALERLVLATEEIAAFCEGMDSYKESYVLSDEDTARIRIRCGKDCPVHGG